MERDPEIETPFWRRGPVVLVVLALLIVTTASTAFIGNWFFDVQREKRVASDARASALAAREAWNEYAAETGREAGDAVRAFRNAETAETADAWEDALSAYLKAFERESKRLETDWDSQVKAPWQAELSRHFPFDSEAATDAPLSTVEHLLNPLDGRVWVIAAQIDRLTNTELEGRRIALPPPGYNAFMARARALRDALFPLNTARVYVPIDIEFSNGDAQLEVDGEPVPARKTALHWEGGGASLTAGDVAVDYAGRDWGLLRLLGELEPDTMLRIKVDPDSNPFDMKLYRNIHVSRQ